MSNPTIAIVTDSTACIPQDLREELQIHEVAYYIHRGIDVLRDLVTIQREEFLKWLPTAKELPKTASPGPGDYFQAYNDLADAGKKEIFSIHMTSKGSGAYQAAVAAAEMMKEKMPQIRIEVIDTLNVALCQGWITIEAARSAIAGLTMDEIKKKIQNMIPVTRMVQTADTLKYLYMGGRIGKAVHLVGSILSLKPIISMKDGEIISLGVARGSNQAYRKMLDAVESAVGSSGKIKVAYMHAGASSQILKLKDLIETKFECTESFISELSPALMVHTGPGTTGLCYFPVK